MSKINNLNNLKNKLKKFIAVVALFCLLAISSQLKTFPHIPLKGLFKVLKIDDIGFGHALLHSNWIENMYQYGEGKPYRQVQVGNREQWKCEKKNDEVVNLIRKLWFRFSEHHQLLPTQFGPFANIPDAKLGVVFGKLVNCVYQGLSSESQQELFDELIKYDGDAKQFRQELTILWKEVIDEGYALKYNKEFDQVRNANVLLQEEIKKLRIHYKIEELERAIDQASKEWGAKKGFSKVRKEIESKYNRNEYNKALKEVNRRVFALVDPETFAEYREIESRVKKMKADIAKKIDRKRSIIKKALLDPIKKALAYCKASKKYVSRTVEGILWALFFHKLDDLISLEDKIKVINDCIGCIDIKFKREDICELKEFYTGEDIVEFEKGIKDLDPDDQVQVLSQNYDTCLHYFIHLAVGQFSPEIAQGNYGYEYEPGKISDVRPDCHETAILDTFSLLWYSPQTGIFDDSLFSEHVLQNGQGFKRLREALKYLYLADSKGIKVDEYTYEYEGTKFTSITKLKQLGKISEKDMQELDISEVPVTYINRSEIKQEFMNIMSGIEGVVYCSEVLGRGKIFELESGVNNIINEFNYFYGTKVVTVEQLGDKQVGISTDNRTITFEKQKETNLPNKIDITVRNHRPYNYFTMQLSTNSGHTSLSVEERGKIGSQVLKKGVVETILKKMLGNVYDDQQEALRDADKSAPQDDREEETEGEGEDILEKEGDLRSVAMFTLLTSKELLENNRLILNLPALNLLYYSLSMKTPEIKLEIIKDVFERRSEYYDIFKEVIYNLIEKFPLDDEYLRGSLNKIIAISGLYKTELFYQKWIEKCTVDVFLHDIVSVGYADDQPQALCFYNEFIEKIEDINKGQVIVPAISRGYKDIIKLIIQRQEFAVDKNPKLLKVSRVKDAVDCGFKEIAFEIANNPQLKMDFYAECALDSLWKKGHTDILLSILKNPNFKADFKSIGQLLNLALTKGCIEIANLIVKNEAFDPTQGRFEYTESGGSGYGEGFCLVAQSLVLALGQGHTEIAQAIMNNPRFISWRIALLEVLKQEYEGVDGSIFNNSTFDAKEVLNKKAKKMAMMIVSHPQFAAKGAAVGQCLVLALKNQAYKDIVLTVVNNEQFEAGSSCIGQALLLAVTKKYEKVALKIVKNHAFNPESKFSWSKWGKIFKGYGSEWQLVGEYLFVDALIEALKLGYQEIADAIMTNPKFKGVGAALRESVVKGYTNIALYILEHPKFTAENGWATGGAFALALKQDNGKELALKILEHPTFKVKGCMMGVALVISLEKKYEIIALRIMNDPLFDAWGRALQEALEKELTEIAFTIVRNPHFKAIGDGIEKALVIALKYERYKEIAQKILECPEFNYWGRTLSFALETAKYRDVALKIIEHPHFTTSAQCLMSALDLAVRYDQKDVAEKIISNPAFVLQAGRAGRVLGYALQRGYREIAVRIVNDPAFDARYSRCGFRSDKVPENAGEALVLALKKGYIDVALGIVNHSTFEANHSKIGEALVLALEQEHRDIALKIVRNYKFDAGYPGYGTNFISKALELALDKEYADIIVRILENNKFKADGLQEMKIFKLAMEQGRVDIALKFLQNSSFDDDGWGWGYALELAMKQKNKNIVLIIVNNPKFKAKGSGVKKALVSMLQDQEYKDIALNIVEHPTFKAKGDYLGDILKEALSKGYQDIVSKIVNHPTFKPKGGEMGRALVFLLQNKQYHQIAQKIMDHPNFNGWKSAIKAAVKLEETGIIKKIVKHFNFDSFLAADALPKLLEKVHALRLKKNESGAQEYISLVLEITKHPTFIFWSYVVAQALEHKCEDVAVAIVSDTRFEAVVDDSRVADYWVGEALALALECGNKKIALAIVNSCSFKVTSERAGRMIGKALALALQKTEYTEIAEKILKAPQFNAWGSALCWAVKIGSEDFVLELLCHSRWNKETSVCASTLIEALKKDYKTIAIEIAKIATLDRYSSSCRRIDLQALELAIQKEYQEVAFAIVNNPTCEPTGSYALKILVLALNILRQAPLAGVGTQQDERWRDVALAIVKNPKFEAIGYDNYKRKKYKEIIEALLLALKQGYTDVALAIVKNPKFEAKSGWDADERKNILEAYMLAVGNKEYEEVLEAIVSNEHFEGWGDMLEKTVEAEEKNLIFRILSHPKFNAKSYQIGSALVAALKKQWLDIAEALVNHDKFKANCDDSARALILALEQNQKDIALAIVRKPTYVAKGWGLVLALSNPDYQEIAAAIMNNSEFKGWGYALKEALEKGYLKIVQEIIDHLKFQAKGSGMGQALTLSLKNPQCKDIASKIISHSTFEPKGEGMGEALVLLFTLRQAQGGRGANIALDWLKDSRFDRWGEALKVALELKHKDIALTIMSSQKFTAKGYDIGGNGIGKALVLALNNEEYKDIAVRLLQDPIFDGWKEALIFAVKEEFPDITLQLIDEPRFTMKSRDMDYPLHLALQKGYTDIMVKIISRPQFNIKDCMGFAGWIDKLLGKIQKVIQEHKECAQELQKVIDLIESRKKGKIII